MIYNFSAGPSTVYKEVLLEIKESLMDYSNQGYSLLESSHRGAHYDAVHNNAIQSLKSLLNLDDTYEVLFVGGGATLQFAMLAYNFLLQNSQDEINTSNMSTAQYFLTGSWAKAAVTQAQKVLEGNKGNAQYTSASVELAFDGTESKFSTLPNIQDIASLENNSYIHITSNETIDGIQWKSFPDCSSPVIVDMSSDILSRAIPTNKFSMIYAGAQKNLGVAGVTIVVLSKELLSKANTLLPNYLSYTTHAQKNSLYNTPPVFAIWVLERVLNHIITLGGVEAVETINDKKAKLLYDTIDNSQGFYVNSIANNVRSSMNVIFRIADETLEKTFIEEATHAGLHGLKGHRSVGGCRASIYNAMPLQGVQALCDFMLEFMRKHG